MRLSPSIALLRTQSDARLVALAREGSEAAFALIVERHRRAVMTACRRILPEARAEDASQQVFVAAWRALARGDDVRDVRPWLLKIARNTSLNALRLQGYDYDELRDGLRVGPAPDEELERRDVIRQTLAGLAALPERQREVLLRSAVEGAPHADIARDLGLSEGATRQLMLRARTTLRAAASALTPWPLAAWAAQAGGGAAAAGGTGALAAKVGAAAVLAGGVAVGTPAIVPHERHAPERRAAAAAAAPPVVVAAAAAVEEIADEAPAARRAPRRTATPGPIRTVRRADPRATQRRVSNRGPRGDERDDDDHSGPGGGERDDDDHSGPGGGERDDDVIEAAREDSSGPGSGGTTTDDHIEGTDNSGSGSSGTSGTGTSGSGTSGSGTSGSDTSGSGTSGSGTSGSGTSGSGSGELVDDSVMREDNSGPGSSSDDGS